MIDGKHINKVIAAAVLLALIFCAWIVYAANANESSYVPEYQKRLFGGEVVAIDIQVDVADWQSLLDNAQAKEWISGDLAINGEIFSSVGIRTKGNSSLSQTGGRGGFGSNNRYSLQFKMNYTIKGQTYYGLDVFCVNNLMGDATYMKDYIAYDIMKYIGVKAPLAGYAKVTVNGEDYGFCLLLERYEMAYLDRAYNTSAGYLYNVKIQMGQRDNFMNFGRAIENNEDTEDLPDIVPNRPNRNADRGMGGNRGMGGGFGGSNGGSLVYTDDEPGSYSSIFDNAVFGSKTTEDDMGRVIAAIKNLNEGTNLEQYWNVDEILRYLAAHTVVVNLDSYSSNMQQNYYIYEKEGKITILPWDYGLAFGGFMSGSASDVVNFPIDTPVSVVTMEERPLINKLLEVPEYREKYHEYLRKIVEGYFYGGLFEDKIKALDAAINAYVKTDVSAYFTHEQYEASLSVFIALGKLRAESIAGQLDKTIPSTTEAQRENPSALVEASSIDLSALGSMMGGGGFGGDWGDMPRDFPEGMPDRFGQDGFDRRRPENMPDEFVR